MKTLIFTLSLAVASVSSYAQFTTTGNPTTTMDNVGIGTPTASSKLTIDGNSATNGSLAISNGPGYFTWDFVRNGHDLQIGRRSATAGSTFYNTLLLDANGNVGIGATALANKLEVDGGASAAAIRISTTNTGAGVASLILANSTKSAYNDGIVFSHGAGYTTVTGLSGSANIMTYDVTNARVGIGTTSPTTGKLVVENTGGSVPGITVVANDQAPARIELNNLNGQRYQFVSGLVGASNSGFSLYDATNGATRMYFNSSGNVGIGTTTPGAKFHIQADANTSGAPDNAQFYITGNSSSGKRLSLGYNTSSNYGEIQSQAYSGSYTALNLNPNGGNVLIGQTSQNNPSYKLDINGTARAKEIIVNSDGADFVFEPEYNLPKLSEIKNYIDQNHHLPQISSAAEMQKNGMSIGELNTKLLQKIEELTLYLIEKDKQVNEQKGQLYNQQEQINQLKEQLTTLIKANK